MSEGEKICRLNYEVLQRAIAIKQSEWNANRCLAIDDPEDRALFLRRMVYPDQGVFYFPGSMTSGVMEATRASVLMRHVSPFPKDGIVSHPVYIALASTLEAKVLPLKWHYTHAHLRLRMVYALDTAFGPRDAEVVEQGHAIKALKEKDRASKVMSILMKQKNIPYSVISMLYAGYTAQDIQTFFRSRSDEIYKIVGKKVRLPSKRANADSRLFGDLKLMIDRKVPLETVVQNLVEHNWIEPERKEEYLRIVPWKYEAAEIEFGRADVWGEKYYREHVGKDVAYLEENVAILSSRILSFRPLTSNDLEHRQQRRKVAQ